MRVLCGIAVGALASFGAGAQDNTPIDTLIETGRAVEASARLQTDAERDAWIRQPQELARLCERVAGMTEALAAAGDHGERIAVALDRIASETLTRHRDRTEALHARAYSGVCWARLLAESGRPGAAERWTDVATDFTALADRVPDRPEFLLEAADAVGRSVDAAGVDPRPGFARADALLARIPKEAAATPRVAARLALIRIEWARISVRRKVVGAEDLVSRALEILRGPEAADRYDPHLGTAHNDAAATVRVLGLGRPKADFVSETSRVGSGLEMQVPLSTLWIAPSSDGPISQTTRCAMPRREFRFQEWPWDTEHKFGKGPYVKGTSIKGVADARFEEACGSLKEVRLKVPPKRATLKQCNPGWFFEVQGLDATGRFVRNRTWFFKSTQGQDTTFELTVEGHRENDADDPELQFVLDSIREPKK